MHIFDRIKFCELQMELRELKGRIESTRNNLIKDCEGIDKVLFINDQALFYDLSILYDDLRKEADEYEKRVLKDTCNTPIAEGITGFLLAVNTMTQMVFALNRHIYCIRTRHREEKEDKEPADS